MPFVSPTGDLRAQAPARPVALVTGASRGIGRATATKLAEQGYSVVGLYLVHDADAQRLVEERPAITMLRCDVGCESDVVSALALVSGKYHRLDVVVNNAGIDIPGSVEQYAVHDWDRMVGTCLRAVFLVSKYAIPHLRKSPRPVMVNVSSRLGLAEYVSPPLVVYGAVKAAVNNFTIGLARELEPWGIRVNAAIPALTKTDLFDQLFTPEQEKALLAAGRLGTPEQAADLIVRLIGDESANGMILADERLVASMPNTLANPGKGEANHAEGDPGRA
jgi:NAD(P)-dependent dehydrogenase (short-subunit alcohol dehydrogenase family)